MKYISFVQKIINKVNRKKLKNQDFTLVTSNCTGGILYHWLGLKFRSPFINLYMSNEDYIKALKNFDVFLSTPLKEYKEKNYPIGIGYSNVKIHFVHYTSFEEANNKWKERIGRIDKQNLCIWLTNWGGGIDVLESFEKLPFQNKLVFVNRPFPEYKSAVYLRGFEKCEGVGQIYRTKNFWGKRFIDDFNYIEYFNNMKERN